MATEHAPQGYRRWYARLLRLYPKRFYERFGEGMAQTFDDLLREREGEGRNLPGWVLCVFLETALGVVQRNMEAATLKYKNILWIALVTGLILLVPLGGMLVSDEVNWNLFDFAVAGVLIFGTGLAYELVARRGGSTAYKAGTCMALSAAFLLTWMNLAVGIIGSENNPVNLMYFGVVGIGAAGALIARFQPRGMARALFATALAQALVPLLALLINQPDLSATAMLLGVVQVLVLNAFFVVLFLGSGILFCRVNTAMRPRASCGHN